MMRKQTGQDMALLIEEPDDLLDAELIGMFPKGRTRIADSVMVETADGLFLIRKDDIALALKRREDAIRAALIAAYCGSIGCMIALIAQRIVHPMVGLPVIGYALLILCALQAMKKRDPQKYQF